MCPRPDAQPHQSITGNTHSLTQSQCSQVDISHFQKALGGSTCHQNHAQKTCKQNKAVDTSAHAPDQPTIEAYKYPQQNISCIGQAVEPSRHRTSGDTYHGIAWDDDCDNTEHIADMAATNRQQTEERWMHQSAGLLHLSSNIIYVALKATSQQPPATKLTWPMASYQPSF